MRYQLANPLGRVVLAALAMVRLTSSSIDAQTPARPAVEVRQMPELLYSLWPADVNEDGRTDLIAGLEPGPPDRFGSVVVRIGNGDGTFGPDVYTSSIGVPVTTGDFNGDRHVDVVILDETHTVSILPGRGDGTFDAPRTVDLLRDFAFALSGDLNADGIRDLVVGRFGSVDIHPGLGDFTFGPTVSFPASLSDGLQGGILADVDGDGSRDIVVAQDIDSLAMFRNRGGMLFERVDVFVARDDLRSVTAADLDGDGDQDLAVTHSGMSNFEPTTGGLEVLLGNGDGTFAAPVHYETGVNGPITVVVGQFNGDQRLDLAVGSQSYREMDMSGPTRFYWDSVSIFPGLGNGAFGQAATFALDFTTQPDTPNAYLGAHHALKTSDVNGDRRTDLIASPGAVLVARAASANRPPSVYAGPDVTAFPGDEVRMRPTLADPDWDWVKVEWGDQATGEFFTDIPSFWLRTEETVTLVVRVTDTRGGVATDTVVVRGWIPDASVSILRPRDESLTAGQPFTIWWSTENADSVREFDIEISTDDRQHWTPIAECTNLPGTVRSCTWRNPAPAASVDLRITGIDARGLAIEAQTGAFSIFGSPGQFELPAGWWCTWIGAVAAMGNCGYSNGAFTVEGSGADIWGTADELQAAARSVEGDFSITARVASVENVNRWTKVGLMIRDGANPSDAGSRHASFFVTPTAEKGTAFQRRPTNGGTSVSSAGPITTAPIWLKLTRTGDVIRAFYRKNVTDGWTLVGTQTFSGLPAQLAAALVVSSHVDGTLATGVFDSVVVDELEPMESSDIGSTAAGTTVTDSATLTLEGNGADIWGAADAFRFHYARWVGDGTITVRVRSVENTHAWAKAGVMIRETTAANSKQVMAIVSAGKGLAMQYRAATGGVSANAALAAGMPPRWLRLTRVGNTFTASASVNGTTWTTLGSTTVPMIADVLVGLAVTSHSNGTLATAVFDDLLIQP